MLNEDEVRGLVSDMWRLKQHERPELDEIYDYMLGRKGVPKVPTGSEREIEDMAKLSVKNVLPLVRDAFAQNLSVTVRRWPRRTTPAGRCGRRTAWMLARTKFIGRRSLTAPATW